jgi:hypothetical protein
MASAMVGKAIAAGIIATARVGFEVPPQLLVVMSTAAPAAANAIGRPNTVEAKARYATPGVPDDEALTLAEDIGPGFDEAASHTEKVQGALAMPEPDGYQLALGYITRLGKVDPAQQRCGHIPARFFVRWAGDSNTPGSAHAACCTLEPPSSAHDWASRCNGEGRR